MAEGSTIIPTDTKNIAPKKSFMGLVSFTIFSLCIVPLRMEPITKAPNASEIPALIVITTIRKHKPRETTIRVSPVRKFFIFLKIVGIK